MELHHNSYWANVSPTTATHAETVKLWQLPNNRKDYHRYDVNETQGDMETQAKNTGLAAAEGIVVGVVGGPAVVGGPDDERVVVHPLYLEL